MRDPARIDRMIELLRAAWHASPDLRLGQLIANLTPSDDDPYGTASDEAVYTAMWNREDDAWERALHEWIGERR